MEDIAGRLAKVVDVYSKENVGREKTVRLIVLALITKQHIYMVSPPGTGKTLMENVARSFGMTVFYYLYNYDVKLEDILYNPIIKKIPVDDGEKIVVDYELKNPGLGTTDIHFADEMFKAPTPVLNALLGAMNERRVTLGSREYKIPLWTLIAASNELPENADALLDRFLFRDFLKYLPKEMWVVYLAKYWEMHQPGYGRIRITVPRTVIEEANRLVWSVDVTGILDDYVRLLDRLEESNIVLSDRRKGRILRAIAASAILDGRLTAEPEDLEVLLYTAPTTPEELDTVSKVVDEFLGGLLKTKRELESIENQVRAAIANLPSMSIERLVETLNTVPNIRSKLTALSTPSLSSRIDDIIQLVNELEEQALDTLAVRLLREAGIEVVARAGQGEG